jgi:MraZ protein
MSERFHEETFSGCFMYSVDEKNRVSIPPRFRSALGRLVLTKGIDGCVWALTQDQWQLIKDRAEDSVELQRFFVAPAEERVLGANGRCLMPDHLRQHADIKPGDEVTIVGLGSRVEIWSSRRWESVSGQLTTDLVRQELPEFFTGAKQETGGML